MTTTTEVSAKAPPLISQMQSLYEAAERHRAQEARDHEQRERQKLMDTARAAVAKVLGLSAEQATDLLHVEPAAVDEWSASADVRYNAPDGLLWFRVCPSRYLGPDYGYSGDEVRVLTQCGHCGGRVLAHDPHSAAHDLTSIGYLLNDPYVARGDIGHCSDCILADAEQVSA